MIDETGIYMNSWPQRIQSTFSPSELLSIFLPRNLKKHHSSDFSLSSIISTSSKEIYIKNSSLDQVDLSIYLYLLGISKDVDGKRMVSTSNYSIIKEFKNTAAGKNYDWLEERMEKLVETNIFLTTRGDDLIWETKISLISYLQYDDSKLTMEVFPLFEPNFIDMELRRKLGNRRQKALAFHAWLSVNKPLKKGIWVTKEQLKTHFSSNKDESMGVFIKNFRRDVIDRLLKEKFLLSVEEKDTCFGFWHSSGKKKAQKD